jgi:hypothetical protein
MSLENFLKPVLGEIPNIAERDEVEVLRDLPAETAFFALKEADNDMLLWFFENADVEQVQAVLDLECWNGDNFQAERFLNIFHFICKCSPEKLHEYMKDLDPEIIVRTLIEYTDVFNFDPQEPPAVEEHRLLLSPDSLYAIIFKSENPELRESLMQWLNKISAVDLQLMRRHLESCRWEQKTEIEEFAYGIKKGRLEDLGFLDPREAVSMYSRGDAPSFKKQLLENPLPSKSKEESLEALESIEGAFVPEIMREPLSESEIFAEALKKITAPSLKEVLLMEALRSMNISIMADDLIHEDLATIREATDRSRRYLDLGLFYLSEANIDRCSEILITQSLHSCTRLGWLLVHDLVKAAKIIRDSVPLHYWNSQDKALLEALQGRHPELNPMLAKDLGLSNDNLISLEAVLKVAERLNQLSAAGQFFKTKFAETLELNSRPLVENETLLARLFSALAHQVTTGQFQAKAVTPEVWDKFVQINLEKELKPALKIIIQNAPSSAQAYLEKRFTEAFSEIETYLQNKKTFPDSRFFKALLLANT